jgi:hypothetical protein
MQAMILTAPPQAGQVSMSMSNTRFRRCAQLIATDGMYAGFAGAKTGHRGAAFGRGRRLRIRHRGRPAAPAPPGLGHPSPVTAVGGEHAVIVGPFRFQ